MIIFQRLAKGVGYVFVDVEIEMIKLIFAKIWPAEWTLKGEAVNNVELLPQSNLP